MKEIAFKFLVRPVHEYGSSSCDPHCVCLIDELGKVQKRAATFETRSESMTGIIGHAKTYRLSVFPESTGNLKDLL